LPRASGVDAAEFMVTHHHYDHADAGTSTCSSRSSACASSPLTRWSPPSPASTWASWAGRDRLHIARVRYGRPDQDVLPVHSEAVQAARCRWAKRRRARRDNRAPRWRRRAHERVPRLQPRRLRSRNVGGLLPFAGRLGL